MKYIVREKQWDVSKLDRPVLFFALVDRPDHITSFNAFIWRNSKKQWHRNYELPALVTATHAEWFLDNVSYGEII